MIMILEKKNLVKHNKKEDKTAGKAPFSVPGIFPLEIMHLKMQAEIFQFKRAQHIY